MTMLAESLTRSSDSLSAAWQLYILRTGSGMFYTGITLNLARRLQQHQSGSGAKALRGKGPLTLVYSCHAGDRSSALKLEYRIKRLKKSAKTRLVLIQPDSLLAWLSSEMNGSAMHILPHQICR